MLNQIQRFMLDENGLETVEWAIVGGVVTAVVVALFAAIGQDAFNGLTSLGVETSLIPQVIIGTLFYSAAKLDRYFAFIIGFRTWARSTIN